MHTVIIGFVYSCLWLLALVKHCIKQEVVKTHLLEIQAAFMGLLGDNNDLVQDAASKGIAIVYEACTEDQRDGMVNNLLDTILGKKPQEVKKVTDTTKVFQEGELGKVPDSVGGNLSTYKELCSLATDMGQPDLVYKFMHLANYNATWNSKKGAAFGFSTIASKAGSQLEPHLPKVYFWLGQELNELKCLSLGQKSFIFLAYIYELFPKKDSSSLFSKLSLGTLTRRHRTDGP